MVISCLNPAKEAELLDDRNRVIAHLEKKSKTVQFVFLSDDTFQAGLDALDPALPCFTFHPGDRKILADGMIEIIDAVCRGVPC